MRPRHTDLNSVLPSPRKSGFWDGLRQRLKKDATPQDSKDAPSAPLALQDEPPVVPAPPPAPCPDLGPARTLLQDTPVSLGVRALQALISTASGAETLREQSARLEQAQKPLGQWLTQSLDSEQQQAAQLTQSLAEARRWRQGAVQASETLRKQGAAQMTPGLQLAGPDAQLCATSATRTPVRRPVIQAMSIITAPSPVAVAEPVPWHEPRTQAPTVLTPDFPAAGEAPSVQNAFDQLRTDHSNVQRRLLLALKDLQEVQSERARTQQELRQVQETLRSTVASSQASVQRAQEEQAHLRRELLDTLRERDSALYQQRTLEANLSVYASALSDEDLHGEVDGPGGHERYFLLSHARRRLREHFGIDLTYAEISSLDEQARTLPQITRTWRMTPVKMMRIEDHEVFLIVTPDTQGQNTITTAYTREMLEVQGAI